MQGESQIKSIKSDLEDLENNIALGLSYEDIEKTWTDAQSTRIEENVVRHLQSKDLLYHGLQLWEVLRINAIVKNIDGN